MIENPRSETRAALSAVDAGLRIALARAGADKVTLKGVRDLVTATDVAVEDAVRAALAETGLPVVGEERGGDLPVSGGYWLVDPICGTRNFASGTPLFCVNVALVEGGQVTVAAVGDPTTGGLLYAERGRGAWVTDAEGDRRLETSTATETLVVDDAGSKDARRAHAARFASAVILADRWDFRSMGTTLALPYVAAARVSAYACFHVRALHGAPGTLLVSEAGGMVSDIDGDPWTIESSTMLAAATSELHADLLGISQAARG